MNLITTNLYCFSYTIEELLTELLGGVKIDTLDRMRVTYKSNCSQQKIYHLHNAELAGLSVRHNLDLYNDVQVEKFIRRVAEKLETGIIALTKVMVGITDQLEEYRLSKKLVK